MEKTIEYEGIKKITYKLTQNELEAAALKYVKSCNDIINCERQSFNYEWFGNTDDEVYLEIIQKITLDSYKKP